MKQVPSMREYDRSQARGAADRSSLSGWQHPPRNGRRCAETTMPLAIGRARFSHTHQLSRTFIGVRTTYDRLQEFRSVPVGAMPVSRREGLDLVVGGRAVLRRRSSARSRSCRYLASATSEVLAISIGSEDPAIAAWLRLARTFGVDDVTVQSVVTSRTCIGAHRAVVGSPRFR